MKFPEAQAAMIDYLKSSEFKEREDSGDTLSSIDILIKINSKGFITSGSQEGSCKKGYNPEEKLWWASKERAYISGYMKHTDARKFIDWINMNTDKVAMGQWVADVSDNAFYNKIGNHLICVTQEATANTKEKLETARFSSFSNIPFIMNTHNFELSKKHVKLNKSENVVHIICFDPTYCRNAQSKDGLYKDVLDALNTI